MIFLKNVYMYPGIQYKCHSVLLFWWAPHLIILKNEAQDLEAPLIDRMYECMILTSLPISCSAVESWQQYPLYEYEPY